MQWRTRQWFSLASPPTTTSGVVGKEKMSIWEEKVTLRRKIRCMQLRNEGNEIKMIISESVTRICSVVYNI